jgi:hypothetical protein
MSYHPADLTPPLSLAFDSETNQLTVFDAASRKLLAVPPRHKEFVVLLVRVINSQEALIEALKTVRDSISGDKHYELRPVLAVVRAAIEAAKGAGQ